MEKINSYKELPVYQGAIELAVEIFELTKHFPAEVWVFEERESRQFG